MRSHSIKNQTSPSHSKAGDVLASLCFCAMRRLLLFIAWSQLWLDTPVVFASDLTNGASEASDAAYDEAILGAGDINLANFALADDIDPQSTSEELHRSITAMNEAFRRQH